MLIDTSLKRLVSAGTLCCVMCGAPPAAAQPSDPIVLADALVLPAVGRAGRNPLPTDDVSFQIAHGAWQPAAEGATVLRGTEEVSWKAARANADGRIEDRALQGGYLYWSVSSDAERVWILEAQGHSLAYVNGEPRAGDPYSNGIMRVPVRLRPGANELLFRGARGAVAARLTAPPAEVYFGDWDHTSPDVLSGFGIDAWAAMPVVNATAKTLTDAVVVATHSSRQAVRTPVGPIPPFTTRKLAFRVAGPPVLPKTTAEEFTLELQRGGATLATATLRLAARGSSDLQARTFASDVDGSVQYYALRPALPLPKGSPARSGPAGIILSLHGAGVEARNQAASYGAKTWAHVVAPTNRRPFGFDWEDWGRVDALEVLEAAQRDLATNREKTYLTGHSMGGHGTWHLGVTYPDRFAAVGPSAGWISFWSYAGAARFGESPLGGFLERASASSDTLAMLSNLTPLGVYVLHGDADDNVPVGQARELAEKLREFHRDFTLHEQPGAGHWWDDSDASGVGCVDWGPMLDLFARRAVPPPAAVRRVDFVTVNPAVSSQCHWVAIAAQRRALAPSRAVVTLDVERRRFSGTTENVALLGLDTTGTMRPGEPLTVELDGQTIADVPGPIVTGSPPVWLAREGEAWKLAAGPAPADKNPRRGGPFKQAFANRFALVYGTGGTAEETAWGLARARFDAETFWYRGNGSVDVYADVDFEPARQRDRNVILYGNAATNARFDLVDANCGVRVERGRVRVGQRQFEGDDLTCLFLHPRAGSDVALVGVVGGSGLPGMRATEMLPYFVSGVSYPDWIVLRTVALREGLAGVVGAGFFGNDWSVERGEAVWN